MEVLCNGRVGYLLAELSAREVIELLGRYRYLFDLFPFSTHIRGVHSLSP